MYQWQTELEEKISTSFELRGKNWIPDNRVDHTLLITGHNDFSRKKAYFQLTKVNWDIVVVDEAH